MAHQPKTPTRPAINILERLYIGWGQIFENRHWYDELATRCTLAIKTGRQLRRTECVQHPKFPENADALARCNGQISHFYLARGGLI